MQNLSLQFVCTDVHSVKTLQIINFLMFSNKSLHILKKFIVHVSAYDLLLPTSINGLKIFFHKIQCIEWI